MAERRIARGMSKTSIYSRWCGMLARCYNKNSKKYSRYGARGIRVHGPWHNFDVFYNYIGDPPSNDYSLDRIDNNKNYEPGNVRWATQKQQQNNRNDNRRLIHDGKNLLVTEWAEITGISSKVIRQRIDRDKMSVKDALTKKVYKKPASDRHITKRSRGSGYTATIYYKNERHYIGYFAKIEEARSGVKAYKLKMGWGE